MYKLRKGVIAEQMIAVGSDKAAPAYREAVTLKKGGYSAADLDGEQLTREIPEITQEQIEWIKTHRPSQFEQLFYEEKVKTVSKASSKDKDSK